MHPKPIETFCPATRQQWREWLTKNHRLKQSIWLVSYKKATGVPTIAYSDAVDEALCFGWIDSTARPIDDEKFMRFFCKRKPKSVWSKINKQKVEGLMAEGLMAEAGLQVVELARKNGSWQTLGEVEELKIPADLNQMFKTLPGSKKYFTGLSRSVQKAILQWLVLAKRPETRQKRIQEIAQSASEQQKPKQFR